MNISSIDGGALIGMAAGALGIVAFLALLIIETIKKDPRWK